MLKTPLHKFHLEYHAKMVEFTGWEMPMLYTSIREEHEQVRTSGGVFDVSHMGRVKVQGRHARKLLERVCSRRITDMQTGQCRYSLVCNERGGVRDDVLVYKLDDADYLVVVNASNREKLLGHFEDVRSGAAGGAGHRLEAGATGGGGAGHRLEAGATGRGGGEELKVTIEDQTESTAMVAVQGPKVMEMVANFSKEIPALKRYRFTVKNLLVMKVLVSRTGYTGEDGVEAILPAGAVNMALQLLLKDVDMTQAQALIKPAGLGARDTLRMEAGMPLYGQELGEDICALSCGVDFAITMDKHEAERGERFIGQDALEKIIAEGGPSRRIVGLALEGRRTPRPGHAVLASGAGGEPIGRVTSGCLSPTLGHPIAMALVDSAHAEVGTTLAVDAGRTQLEAEVVKLPFYKAAKPKPAATGASA
ncbi:MAG: glycine cleavage system aminomethyltransferase GcvT [Planctomycetota bacterium]|nr:glycine cleavage system aminomethyltransferase GcvT [Planctomycetota bacterium]